jgi:hypothetical protein
VVFGVRALWSLTAHDMHQLNVHRERANHFWRKFYAQEGNLPYTPFLLHCFTSIVPCLRSEDGNEHAYLGHPQHRDNRGTQRPQSDNNPRDSVSPWQASFQCDQSTVNTFVLSAHVHGDCPLSEFQCRTLVPLRLPNHHLPSPGSGGIVNESLHKENTPNVFYAPQLLDSFPSEWKQL